MLKNYFKTAIRTLWKNKVFSFINISGLAIGISASLVIYLIVSYDFGFDKFQPDSDRIYRVVANMKFPDQDIKLSGVPMPLKEASKKEITGVEIFAPFNLQNGDMNISIPIAGVNKPAVFRKQSDIIFADNNYFKITPYEWLAGSQQNSLEQPFSVVLTQSRAKTYFPYTDVSKVVGQTIIYNDSIKMTVSGVVKDIEAPTDFIFKEFISYSTITSSGIKDVMGLEEWGSISSSSQFFIKLNKGVTKFNIEKQVQTMFDKHQKDAFLKMTFSLQNLKDIHFNPDYGSFTDRQAHLPTLYGLLTVAVILLLLGCINFINLTTAQAAQRAKEVGIRKTMGSSRTQLLFQFISETFILTVTATLLSLALVPWLLKVFANFIPPALNTGMLYQTNVIVFIAILVLTVSLFSGFYPAVILSKYKPVQVLKNQSVTISGNTRRAWLRKSLTVTQFVVAQSFIIVALMVSKQIRFVLNKDLGFRKDGIVAIQTPSPARNIKEAKGTRNALLHKLEAIPGIEKICLAGSAPAANGYSVSTIKYNDGKKDIETTVEVKYADENYFKIYNMKLLAGKFLTPADSATGYVINANYAQFLGFKNPQEAIGKMLNRGDRPLPVVGVINDFYARSLHSPIKPLVYTTDAYGQGAFHIVLKPTTEADGWKNTISQVEKEYKAIYPGEEFRYNFVDEVIAKFYKSEQDISRLLKWATGLAIFISCLGLLGLVIYTTNLRYKEMGVRKVLGASVMQLFTLLSNDFIKLVLIAFIIAAPLAWYAANKWLQSFAYRTSISWWVFAVTIVLMILIAIITLSFKILKTAFENPVKSLRTE
ncbi:MAG: ABC transporter permease [Sphingobacteriales bacterium]|nr:ABC transporter permease [Sphingobacteriales bacterium]